MLKKLSIIMASLLLLCTIIASPHIYESVQFKHGNMVKVLEVHDVQATEEGGFAMHFTVQDYDGNIYEVRTGFIAQWDKDANDYINTKYLRGDL